MTTLTSGRIAPRIAPRAATGPSLWETLSSQLASLYETFMDVQVVAFRRAAKTARTSWQQVD